MDKYYEKDLGGRIVLNNLAKNKCKRLKFSGPKGKIDAFATGYTKTAAIEIKDRRNGGYYAEEVERCGGQYIHKHKYDDLINAMVQSGYTPYLMAIFEDWIYFWDLTNLKLTFHEEWLKNTEVEDNGWSWQLVSNLHIKDAIARYETRYYS